MSLSEVLLAVLTAWGLLGSLAWLVTCAIAARTALSLNRLSEQPLPEGKQEWPRLSVIVAASNEENTLEAAARTLLAQDYPNLEIVLVNDRSTDSTGTLVDQLAAGNERTLGLHITELPAGWLGKTHALARGTDAATGQWLLYTDADVHFAPGALRRAITFAQKRSLDHLTVAPDLHLDTFPLAMMAGAFGLQFMAGLRWAQRPGSQMGVGVGAFNLARASKLAASEGFEWFPLEIADDAGLATVLKRAGARSEVVSGLGVLSLTWYATAREMVRGFEKNLFGLAAGYSYPRALLAVLSIWLYAAAPVVALLAPTPWVKGTGLAVFATLLANGLGAAKRFGQAPWPAPFAPAGMVMIGWALLRSTWLAWRRGGIIWRGTRYDVATLRAGRRIDLLAGSKGAGKSER